MITDYLQSNIIKLVFSTIRQYWPSHRLSILITLSNGKSMTKFKMIPSAKIPVYGANGIIGATKIPLVNCSTITIGRVGSCGAINMTSGPAWVSDNAMWIESVSNEICIDYLYFALKSLPLAEGAKVAAMPSISQSHILQEEIPCPNKTEQLQIATFLKEFLSGHPIGICAPLPAQFNDLRRILARIEELATRIEEALELRRRAEEETEAFAQIFLDRVYSSNILRFGGLPLDEACITITDGDHLTPSFTDSGVKFIFVGNVSSGIMHFNGCKYVDPDYYAAIKSHRKPRKGDVLYSAVGATLGIPAIVNTNEIFCFQRHVALIRPNPKIITTEYLWYMLRSKTLFKNAWSETTGSAQPTVPLRAIRALQIPVPSKEEQCWIVSHLDSLQTKLDALKRHQAETAVELDALLPAVLERAFRGEL